MPVVHINNRGISTVNDKLPAGAEAMDWIKVIPSRSRLGMVLHVPFYFIQDLFSQSDNRLAGPQLPW